MIGLIRIYDADTCHQSRLLFDFYDFDKDEMIKKSDMLYILACLPNVELAELNKSLDQSFKQRELISFNEYTEMMAM